MLKKIAIFVSAILLGTLTLLFFLGFQFTKPSLPETNLNALDMTQLQKSTQILLTNSLQKPANVSLSPRQVSYLAQNNKPKFQRYGLELNDVHYESTDEFGHARATFKGPFGSWLKVDWTGKIDLHEKKKGSVSTKKLWAGKVPIHWIAPDRWSPDWPTEFNNGQVTLHRAKLDAQGLRARLSHNGLNLDIPGVDLDKGLIEEGIETLKGIF